MYGSETWPMKVEHELKLNRTEMSMIRWRGCLRGGGCLCDRDGRVINVIKY